MIEGFTRDEIIHEILFAPRRGIVPLDDTIIIDRPGFWQIVTPTFTRGGMNEIQCSSLPDDVADAVIDEAIAAYQRLGLRFRWTVGPGLDPDGLVDKLTQRGLERWSSLGMARSTDLDEEARFPGVSVEEVDAGTVGDFTRIMAEGWQMDAGALGVLHRRVLADPARRCRLFAARLDGEISAVASYVALDRSVHMNGAVALPDRRGRGLYRALVDTRLRHAAAQGFKLATTVARLETSAKILPRLGFEAICDISMFMPG